MELPDALIEELLRFRVLGRDCEIDVAHPRQERAGLARPFIERRPMRAVPENRLAIGTQRKVVGMQHGGAREEEQEAFHAVGQDNQRGEVLQEGYERASNIQHSTLRRGSSAAGGSSLPLGST